MYYKRKAELRQQEMQNRINLRNNPMETVKDLVVDNLTGGAISG